MQSQYCFVVLQHKVLKNWILLSKNVCYHYVENTITVNSTEEKKTCFQGDKKLKFVDQCYREILG